MKDISFKTYYKGKWYLVPKIDMWSYGIDDLPYTADLFSMDFDEEQLFDVEINYNDLLQFTGLTDCKGEEIYEGDIVRFLDKVAYNGEIKFLWLETDVIFEDGEFTLNLKTDDLIESSFNANDCKLKDYVDSMEVIGNIYENSEVEDEF